MANENKNKTQLGKIKTMQHDLERVKNPSRASFTEEAVSEAPIQTPISPAPQDQGDSMPNPVEMTGSEKEESKEVNLELEDPKLEKLFETEETNVLKPASTKIDVADDKKEDSQEPLDISEAVSSLRQDLPESPAPTAEQKTDLGAEIGDSLAKLKGFGTEMESEDNDSASVGSQAANLNQPQAPQATPRPQNPYSRINDIRTKDNSDDFTMEDSGAPTPTQGKQKNIVLIGLVVVLVLVLGGGGYWFFFGNQGEQNTANDTQNQPIETEGETISEEEINTLVDPLQPDTIVQVTPTANIRADIISAVRSLPAETELVEIDLIDDAQNKVTFDQIQSQLTITVPTQISENLDDYMLVAVNDNGSYELGAVLELQDNLAESYLQTWQDTVIQDLSPFRLSQETPTAPSGATLQSVEITQITTGEIFTNYFYNYNDSGQSTDITAKGNIILIGTTQGTMNYLIQNVFIQ